MSSVQSIMTGATGGTTPAALTPSIAVMCNLHVTFRGTQWRISQSSYSAITVEMSSRMRGKALLNAPLTRRSAKRGRSGVESGATALSSGLSGPISIYALGKDQRPSLRSRQVNSRSIGLASR